MYTWRFNSWYQIIPCFLSIIFLGLGGVQPSLYENIIIEEGGKIWIEGKAGIVNYKCEARQLSGVGEIQNVSNPTQNVDREEAVRIKVNFPVQALDCGKEAMNEDMYDALKAEEFPMISYRLLNTSMMDKSRVDRDDWIKIRTQGIMTIAGVHHDTNVDVQGKLLTDNRFRVKGSKQIDMHDYGIEPPSALMGLIKADNKLTVHFDVTVRLIDGSTAESS